MALCIHAIYTFIVIRSLANGGGGGGGGSYLSGFDLEFCTCKHAPPRGDLGACSPRKFLEDTCSEINTETANFEPNIMLQSDKRQKKKKKTPDM